MRIKALIFDIYGTILIPFDPKAKTISDPGKTKNIDNGLKKLLEILKEEFKIHLNDSEQYISYLKEKYFKLIEFLQNKSKEKKKEIVSPEIIIEELWKILLKEEFNLNISLDKLSEIALLVEKEANPTIIERDTYKTLIWLKNDLKNKGVKIGVLSNAQSYTPKIIEENLFKYSSKKINFFDIFDKDICLFSYKLLCSKPDPIVYHTLIDKLSEYNIPPENTLFIGNDGINDIKIPKEFGFKTLFINKVPANIDEAKKYMDFEGEDISILLSLYEKGSITI